MHLRGRLERLRRGSPHILQLPSQPLPICRLHLWSAHCAEDAPLWPCSPSPQYTLLRNSRASPRRFRASSSIFFFQLVLLLGLLLAAVPLGYVVSR